MKRTVLEYDVSIRDVFETSKGYSYEKAKEVLEGALKEIFSDSPGVQVNVKTIREETVQFNEVERVNASEQETVVF